MGREGRSRVAEDVTPGLHARSFPHVDNVSAGRLLYLGTVSLVSDDHPGRAGMSGSIVLPASGRSRPSVWPDVTWRLVQQISLCQFYYKYVSLKESDKGHSTEEQCRIHHFCSQV